MGGIDWIQLRLKNVSYDEYRTIAKEVQAVCRKYNATFIINDNIQLALEVDADGVHVGESDPLPKEEREAMLNKGGIIGCTANSIDDFIHLTGKPVSYIGLGPFRFTTTKQNLKPILGIEGYSRIFREIKEHGLQAPPVIGIGGIIESDVAELLATGLHGIAVSGAISNAEDITDAARKFKEAIKYQFQQ